MKRCLITYQPSGDDDFSPEGLHQLHSELKHLSPIPWSKQEQVKMAADQADKISIQGVQPKLSARLNLDQETFEIVAKKGRFILKPPHPL